jgi:hypothetical protein
MSYSSNYTNRATIFDAGDIIQGNHVKSIYDELGSDPGSVLEGLGIPYRSGAFVALAQGMVAAQQFTSGNLSLWPFLLTRSVTFDRIGVYVTVIGSTGTNVRLGIYRSTADGTPSTLVSGSEVTQSGTVLSASTDTGNVISVALTPGRYYAAVVVQGSGTSPTLQRASTPLETVTTGVSTNYAFAHNTNTSCLSIAGVSGSLSADLTSASLSQGFSSPSVVARMV